MSLLPRVQLSIGTYISQLVDEKKSVLANALRRVADSILKVDQNVHDIDKRVADLPSTLRSQGLGRISVEHIVLNANTTITAPSAQPGDIFIYVIEQDSTGGYSLTWPTPEFVPSAPLQPAPDPTSVSVWVWVWAEGFGDLRLMMPPWHIA